MPKFNKHVIVVGSARSGTSWLCELMARPFRYRLLFEPEHEFNTQKGHLLCDRWIQHKAAAGEGHRYLERVFANRVDNNWIAQHSNRKWKRHLWPFLPKKFIIKFVRCNLAALYLKRSFEIPVVHLVRNPYDVIHSQQRVRFPWLYDLSRFQQQERLVATIQEKYGFNLLAIEHISDTERLALRWCLENEMVLKEGYHSEIHVIFYEKLRDDPALYLQLCEKLGLQPVANIDAYYKKPSSKTHPRSAIREQNGGYENRSVLDYEAVNKILDIFEIEGYVRKHE